jgi:hypothetical protein
MSEAIQTEGLGQSPPPVQQWPRWVEPSTGQVRSVGDSHPGVQLQSGAVSEGRFAAEPAPAANSGTWDFSGLQWIVDWFGDLFSWVQNALANGWGLYLLLFLALLFLGVILYVLSRMNWGGQLLANRDKQKRRRRPVTKEELPFELEAANLTIDGLWGEAIRAKQQGDFRRALMFLYSYLLIELDARQLIRLRRGKTNRNYGQELRPVVAVYPTFAATMDAFERAFFGSYELESQLVDDLFGQVSRLELR